MSYSYPLPACSQSFARIKIALPDLLELQGDGDGDGNGISNFSISGKHKIKNAHGYIAKSATTITPEKVTRISCEKERGDYSLLEATHQNKEKRNASTLPLQSGFNSFSPWQNEQTEYPKKSHKCYDLNSPSSGRSTNHNSFSCAYENILSAESEMEISLFESYFEDFFTTQKSSQHIAAQASFSFHSKEAKVFNNLYLKLINEKLQNNLPEPIVFNILELENKQEKKSFAKKNDEINYIENEEKKEKGEQEEEKGREEEREENQKQKIWKKQEEYKVNIGVNEKYNEEGEEDQIRIGKLTEGSEGSEGEKGKIKIRGKRGGRGRRADAETEIREAARKEDGDLYEAQWKEFIGAYSNFHSMFFKDMKRNDVNISLNLNLSVKSRPKISFLLAVLELNLEYTKSPKTNDPQLVNYALSLILMLTILLSKRIFPIDTNIDKGLTNTDRDIDIDADVDIDVDTITNRNKDTNTNDDNPNLNQLPLHPFTSDYLLYLTRLKSSNIISILMNLLHQSYHTSYVKGKEEKKENSTIGSSTRSSSIPIRTTDKIIIITTLSIITRLLTIDSLHFTNALLYWNTTADLRASIDNGNNSNSNNNMNNNINDNMNKGKIAEKINFFHSASCYNRNRSTIEEEIPLYSSFASVQRKSKNENNNYKKNRKQNTKQQQEYFYCNGIDLLLYTLEVSFQEKDFNIVCATIETLKTLLLESEAESDRWNPPNKDKEEVSKSKYHLLYTMMSYNALKSSLYERDIRMNESGNKNWYNVTGSHSNIANYTGDYTDTAKSKPEQKANIDICSHSGKSSKPDKGANKRIKGKEMVNENGKEKGKGKESEYNYDQWRYTYLLNMLLRELTTMQNTLGVEKKAQYNSTFSSFSPPSALSSSLTSISSSTLTSVSQASSKNTPSSVMLSLSPSSPSSSSPPTNLNDVKNEMVFSRDAVFQGTLSRNFRQNKLICNVFHAVKSFLLTLHEHLQFLKLKIKTNKTNKTSKQRKKKEKREKYNYNCNFQARQGRNNNIELFHIHSCFVYDDYFQRILSSISNVFASDSSIKWKMECQQQTENINVNGKQSTNTNHPCIPLGNNNSANCISKSFHFFQLYLLFLQEHHKQEGILSGPL